MQLVEILKPNMKAAFYGRHSTNKQVMDTQVRRANDFAKKYDIQIVETYTDEAVSSRKKVRNGLVDLIKDAKEGKFELVIVYDHSRLARIPEDHEMLRVTMEAINIHIIECLTENVYSRSQIIASTVKDGLAKYELDKIRQFTKDSIKTLAQNGLWTGGPAPFGYRYLSKYPRKKNKNGGTVDSKTYKEIVSKLPNEMKSGIQDGKFEEINEELMLVEEIFSLYKLGYGFHSIALKMPKSSYRGKDWDKDKVKQIIVNPFYAGYIAIRKRKPGSKNSTSDRESWIMTKSVLINPVISITKWEYCYKLYERRKKRELPPNFFNTGFWLSNLLYCKICDGKMKGKDQRSKGYGKRIYFCPSCKNKALERDVHNEIEDYLSNLHSLKIDNIIEEIKTKIEIQCDEKNDKIDFLRNVVEEEEKKLVMLRHKKDKVFSELNKEKEQKNLIYLESLEMGEEYLMNSITEKNDRINELQNSVISLQQIEANREIIQENITGLYKVNSLPNVEVRRLFLYLFESVYIDSKSKLDINLRMDLKNIS